MGIGAGDGFRRAAGRRLGRKDLDGHVLHRPGRDVTLSAPKSVSLMALVGGDERIVAAHDRAVTRTLAWVERNAVETRMRDKETGAMVRVGGQKMVAATFLHDTSRNLDPQLHTHAVVANMVQGEDGKWRTMVKDGLYLHKMAIGAVCRAELAQGLEDLGYGIEKTHGDGRFEIAGVSRDVVEGFSTRRAEIEAAMAARRLSLSPEERSATDVTAPTRALRDEINGRIRDRLIAEGVVSGSRRQGEKLVSRGLTRAEMARASNYSAGDTVIFNRQYKTLGVDKGDEREVARVDYERNTVWLRDGNGNLVDWRPYMLRPGLGGHRACLSGQDGGPDRRRHAHGEPTPTVDSGRFPVRVRVPCHPRLG